MVSIDRTAQLNLFDTLKTIIKSDSVLKKKFTDRKFHEFEPNMKSMGVRDYPYIVINIPNLINENLDFGHSKRQKDYEIIVEMVIDYKAKDNVKNYCNRIINIIETNESSLTALGLFLVAVNFDGATEEYIKERQSIRSTFTIELRGAIYG